MKDNIFDKIKEKLEGCRSAAILTHVNEDPDTLGSCFAMKRVLENMGKRAVIYISGPVERRLRFIGGDYVIGDHPKEKHDLCICLDCGDIGRISDRKRIFDEADTTLNIDHHGTNTMFADVNYVVADAAAVGEILCRVFREINVKTDDETAKFLYIAIASDTGSFKYSNVTPNTMRAAAELLEHDFDHAEMSRLLFDCKSLKSAKIEADALETMECYEDERIKLVYLTREDYENNGLSIKDVPNLIDIPRCIDGTEIAVCLKETPDGIRVSMRSNGSADVAKVALKFGGGGHVRAAGATIREKTLDEVKSIIVSACAEAL